EHGAARDGGRTADAGRGSGREVAIRLVPNVIEASRSTGLLQNARPAKKEPCNTQHHCRSKTAGINVERHSRDLARFELPIVSVLALPMPRACTWKGMKK